MEFDFDVGVEYPKDVAEFKSVLDRLSAGKKVKLPAKILFVHKLMGGKSNSDVYAAQYWPEKMAVIKVGPISELRNEYQNYLKYLKVPGISNMFTPIIAVTPGLSRNHSKPTGVREALMYEHVQNYDGSKNNSVNFEIEAEQAITVGGKKLAHVQTALRELFMGIGKDLYIKQKKNEPADAKKLEIFWNLRFRADCVIEVDELIIKEKKLRKKNYNQTVEQVYPLVVFQSAVQINGKIKPEMFIEIRNLNVAWFGNRLMGENFNKEKERGQYFRIEVVTDKSQSIGKLAKNMKEGSTFHVSGKVQSMRAQAHRCLLLKVFNKELTERDDLIIGPDNNVIDPFICLADVLKRDRALTTLVHGDLNPRNILVVPHDGYLRPYLIDYALMNEGEPFFLDFVRLEVCLTRDVLPVNLNWVQHIRLQRLLSAACRLGDEAEGYFAKLLSENTELLPNNNEQLASAFSLLLTIRKESLKIYCKALNQNAETSLDGWFLEYMEQLFLFAHIAFKWKKEDRTLQRWKAALRATTTIAYVASECLFEKNLYCKWRIEDLQNDGLEILRFINKHQNTIPINLMALSEMALALDHHDLRPDDPLELEFENASVAFIKQRFKTAANTFIVELKKNHDIYINLRAFMNLKGSFSPGQTRQRYSFKEMLTNTELLAANEHLRALEGGESVLDLIARHGEAITLIGIAGAGKSTVVSELEYRLALSILGEKDLRYPKEKEYRPRLPITLNASQVSDFLKKDSDKKTESLFIAEVLRRNNEIFNEKEFTHLLNAGAFYIIVDALNELEEDQRQQIADWITTLRNNYPRNPILVCHREFNYKPGLLPFPVITLQKVDDNLVKHYMLSYFLANGFEDPEEPTDRLLQLLDNPLNAGVSILTTRPLFLNMIVKCFCNIGAVPPTRGRLFRDCLSAWLEGSYKADPEKPIVMEFSLDKKTRLLGVLGYKLVQQRSTILLESDIEILVPTDLRNNWQKIMQEIVETGLLEETGGGLRFYHQSFQEYFASRYFIEHEVNNRTLIEEKVQQFGWHDTFILLIGFADESPDVVNQLIEISLKYNSLLTARCLSVAEGLDPGLLDRFVQTQKNILKDSKAGSFAHELAVRVLIEYGRSEALAVLYEVAGDPDAPIESRVEILNQLAEIPYMKKNEIIPELMDVLKKVFDQKAPMEVQKAAIKAMVRAGRKNNEFKNLEPYLNIFLDKADWEIKKEAWNAFTELGLEIDVERKASYAQACFAQLDRTKEKLYMESVTEQMNEYNRECIMILGQIATIENLSIILHHRFSMGLDATVKDIVDQIVQSEQEPPLEVRQAYMILREPVLDEVKEIDRLLSLIKDGDDSVASAVGHRLEKLGKKLPVDKLEKLLSSALPLERLRLVAHLINVSNNKILGKQLERLVRIHIKTVDGDHAREAFSGIILSLIDLDKRQGIRLGVIADSIFWTEHQSAKPGYYPWTKVFDKLSPEAEDYEILLVNGGDDAHAAVHWLFSKSVVDLVISKTIWKTTFANKSLKRFRELAEQENNLLWQHYFVGAAVQIHAIELLPWLISLSKDPELIYRHIYYSHHRFGEFNDCYLATVYRAIGYLAQTMIKEGKDAEFAVAHLNAHFGTITFDTKRNVVVGLTTALGYLGEWKPILSHLNPPDKGRPELWMHEAAENIFRHWIPSTPEGKLEKDRAGRWIGNHLRSSSILEPGVRSVLERIKNNLELELGYSL